MSTKIMSVSGAHRHAGVRRVRRRDLGNYLFVIPGLIILTLLMVYPILYNLVISFQNVTVLNLRQSHDFVGLANYATIFRDKVFALSAKNSLVFTVGSIFFQFGIGFLLALFFQNEFPGGRVMRSTMLIAWMLPMVITGTVFKWMLAGDYGVVNFALGLIGLIQRPILWLTQSTTALYGTIIANIWVGIPFNMIVLLAALQSVPQQLYEAARIDGAGSMRRFWAITVPMIMPTILIILLLGIIWTFKVFDLVVIMTSGGPGNASMVLPLLAYQRGFEEFELSQGAAVSSFMFLGMVVFALLYLWITGRRER